MGIDEILDIMKDVGVGASADSIAKHFSLLRLAVSIGATSSEDVDKEMSDCSLVLNQLQQNKLIKPIDLALEGASKWPIYSKVSDSTAMVNIKKTVENNYRDNIKTEVCLVKKYVGAAVVAIYYYGKLIALNVKFNDYVGQQINLDNVAIKGLPKYIDINSKDIIKVYGTLTLRNDDNLDVTETCIATEVALRISEDDVYGFEFNAEYISGMHSSISERLSWAESVGFNTGGFVLQECDIYDIDDYLGERSIDSFDYSDDEFVDCILLMINNCNGSEINEVADNSNLIKNEVAMKIIGSNTKSKYKTSINKLKLVNKNGDTSIVAEVEAFMLNSGEEISEIELTLDEVYEAEKSNIINVIDKNGVIKLERGQ